MPLVVVLDTNFIAVPAQFGVDIFSEAQRVLEQSLEFVILSSALDELEQRISSAKSKTEARDFRIARDLAERCRIEIIEPASEGKSVDDQLLEFAQLNSGVLATNDKELRRRARSAGVPVLLLRGRSHLVLDGTVI
ncbi:MAG: PIN domain-containing protein [Candidatus Thorarchaeota archaeon]